MKVIRCRGCGKVLSREAGYGYREVYSKYLCHDCQHQLIGSAEDKLLKAIFGDN